MDPSLLKERELFKKRALATPVIERKKTIEPSTTSPKDVKKKPSAKEEYSISNMPSYKTASMTSEFKSGVLAKIVKHMKRRHQLGEDYPLSLEDILEETDQMLISNKIKQWLEAGALRQNPKIELTSDNKYIFKPVLKVKDRKSFLRLLKQNDLKGLGGIMLEDVQESLPHCEKALKHLDSEIIYVTRPQDKKKVLFYNDKLNFDVDEEFKKMWRSIPVENMDDDKIEEYLQKQGITSMQDHGVKKKVMPVKRKKPKPRLLKKPRDNEHLANVLQNYDD